MTFFSNLFGIVLEMFMKYLLNASGVVDYLMQSNF